MKQTQTLPSGTTTRQVLGWIEDRITLLQRMREAVVAFDGEPQQPVVVVPPKAAAPRKSDGRSGTLRPMILKVLANGPLTIDELFTKLKKQGWESSATKPKHVLDTTLRVLRDREQVRRVGQDWELVKRKRRAKGQATAETSTTETSEIALDLDALTAPETPTAQA